MRIRAAFWIGAAKAGDEANFRRGIDHELLPAMKTFPGVKDDKALWPQRLEDQPPNLACQVLVEFESRADVDCMLESQERRSLRPRVIAMRGIFEGSLSHIDYEVGT